jgi:hypothetical protein
LRRSDTTRDPSAAKLRPDIGYNCDGTASELGELYYNEFGFEARHSVYEAWSWERWYSYNLVPSYYWQYDPAPGLPSSQCAHTVPDGEIPSFSFLSGYQGVQSNPNALFVILVVPGDEVPPERRWWGHLRAFQTPYLRASSGAGQRRR